MKKLHLTAIRPYSKNVKIHGAKQINALVKNIKNNGYLSPIVVDKNNVIIAGHGRYEALKIIYGKKDPLLPVVVADKLTSKQVKAYRIADNKIGEMSDWDMNNLDTELDAIIDHDDPDAVISLGFTLDEINKIDREARALIGMGPKKKTSPRKPNKNYVRSAFSFDLTKIQGNHVTVKINYIKAKYQISENEAYYFLITGKRITKGN